MRVLVSSAEVVSIADIQSIPIINGDEADGILTLLDGFSIAFPYRLLGGFSLFNPLTTKRIDLLTTGYPVWYGNNAPTAISVQSHSDYNERPYAQADLSLLISSVLVHVPVSDSLRCSAKIAFRKSNVGLAATLLSGSDRSRLESFLPDLNDIQILVNEMPSTNLYTSQEGLWSNERGSLNSIDRTFDYAWQKGFAGATVLTSSDVLSTDHRLAWTQDHVSLSTSVPIESLGNEHFGIDCRFTMVCLNDQFQFKLTSMLKCTLGSEIRYGMSDIRFDTFSSWLNRKSPLRSEFADVSIFSELQWPLTDNLTGTLGVRGTYFGLVELGGIEPRGSLEFKSSDRSSIKLSVGQYIQAPSDFQILHGFLTFLAMPNQTPRMMIMSENRKNLNLQNHYLLALDASTFLVKNNWTNCLVRLNGYYKQTQSLIMPARYPNVFTPLDTMSFEPLQQFRAKKSGCGVSSVIGIIPLHLSLTSSIFTHQSRVTDNRTEKEYRTAGDIPITVKVLLQYNPADWSMNLLYQYSTGIPITDQYFIKSSTILGNPSGEPLFISVPKELNSSRVPDYHRIDLNMTKTWKGPRWTFVFSLGILNLFSNRNISHYTYAFSDSTDDFVIKTPVMNTLPFVPTASLWCEYNW